jgi:AcrR family transcriptional regulator
MFKPVDLDGRTSNSSGMKATKAGQTAATRAKLEEIARALFGARGFEAVSAEELVAQADVTRGALYHHYNGKEGLFAAVVENLMRELHGRLARGAGGQGDPLKALRHGVSLFLDACLEPSVQQILLIDAPAVLGWQRWREMDAKYGMGLLKQALSAAVAAGSLRQLDVDMSAHLLLGALNEAAMLIPRAQNPAKARKAAELTLVALIDGCRAR